MSSLAEEVIKDSKGVPKKWLELHLAQTAALVDDTHERLAADRRQHQELWAYRKGLLGIPDATAEPDAPVEDEVGNISVGDTIIHNYQPLPTSKTAPAQPATPASPASPPPIDILSDGKAAVQAAVPTGLSTAAKLGIAALAAGTGGLGYALPSILNWLKPAPAAVAPVDPADALQYELHLGQPPAPQ